MIKYSVIIPAYNCDKYIERCVVSCMRQDRNDIEIIVIDDGSKDATQRLVLDLASQNSCIRYFYKRNGGVSSARNLGLEKCQGNYVVFVDADDYILDGYLDYVDGVLEQQKDVDLVVFNYLIGTGDDVREMSKTYAIKKASRASQAEAISLYLRGVIPASPWTKVFRASTAKELSFPEGILIGEDAVFSVEYLLRCQGVLLANKSFYVYRQDTGGVTKTEFSRKKLADAATSVKMVNKKLQGVADDQALAYYSFAILMRCLLKAGGAALIESEESLLLSSTMSRLEFRTLRGFKHRFAYLVLRFLSSFK